MKDEDSILIEEFLAGNKRAFDKLYHKYKDGITNFCVNTIGNTIEGEDAAQVTFIKVHKNLNKFNISSPFSPWIYKIALNTCKTYQNRWWSKTRKGALHIDAPLDEEEGESLISTIEDNRYSPQKYARENRIKRKVHEALHELPFQYRIVLILKDLQEKSYAEVAQILGKSVIAVQNLHKRACKMIRENRKDLIDELQEEL